MQTKQSKERQHVTTKHRAVYFFRLIEHAITEAKTASINDMRSSMFQLSECYCEEPEIVDTSVFEYNRQIILDHLGSATLTPQKEYALAENMAQMEIEGRRQALLKLAVFSLEHFLTGLKTKHQDIQSIIQRATTVDLSISAVSELVTHATTLCLRKGLLPEKYIPAQGIVANVSPRINS